MSCFRGEVEIDLDRAGAGHHVETHATDQRHVALHDGIPTFGHPRHRRPSRRGVKPQRGKAHVENLTRGANLGEMAVQFLPGFVQGFQRAAGQLQLARRFKRHRGRALLQPDRVLAVQDRGGAKSGQTGQHIADAARLTIRREIRRWRQIRAAEAELLMLRADAKLLARLAAGREIFCHLSNRRERRVVDVSGIGHWAPKAFRLTSPSDQTRRYASATVKGRVLAASRCLQQGQTDDGCRFGP